MVKAGLVTPNWYERKLMANHDDWAKKQEAKGREQAIDDRQAWARRMMGQISGAGAPMYEPGDDWTQAMIDGSLAEEARLQRVITIIDERFEQSLREIDGERPLDDGPVRPGYLSDLQRDRNTLQEMLTSMGRARGWRVKAKEGRDDLSADKDRTAKDN